MCEPITTGRMLLLVRTSSVVKDSVTVLSGGVAWWREAAMVRAGRISMSEDPSIAR